MAQDLIRFTNTKQFEKDLETISDLIPITMDEIIRDLGLKFFDGVTKRTPVDTGYARASWLFGTNKINEKKIDKTQFPEDFDNSSKAEALNAVEISNLKPDPGRTGLYITNSVPYIVYLEAGRTHQIDKGHMVQFGLKELQDHVSESAKNLQKELDEQL